MMRVKDALKRLKERLKDRFDCFLKRFRTNFREATSQLALALFAIILLIFSFYTGFVLFKEPSSPPSLEKIVSVYVAILAPFLFLMQIADKLAEETSEVRILVRSSLIAISSLVAVSFAGAPSALLLLFSKSFSEFAFPILVLALLVFPYWYNVSRIIGLILKHERRIIGFKEC
jgi:Mn2+/Fe2+ NRAMP family transporter